MRATTSDGSRLIAGRTRAWHVEPAGQGHPGDALVLRVPLVEERRAVPGALEHLGAALEVRVRHHGRLVWEGTSDLAGLEHGGLDRAAAEARRREP